MKLATIDIGTNTTLLLVAQRLPGGTINVLAERAEVTRLGRGIGKDGRLQTASVERTLDVLRGYAAIAAEHGAPIVAVGTEALRAAPNAEDFLRPATQILGIPVAVIGGDREAHLSFLASARSFPALLKQRALVVIDIGGGSTEVIVAESGAVTFRTSVPVGSVRMTERFVKSDPATATERDAILAHINGALASVAWPAKGSGLSLVGTAGTVTTLAALALRLDSYDPDRVHGYRLGVEELESIVRDLQTSTEAERRQMPGLDPKRADVIFAGSCILLSIARTLGVSDIVVSDRGVRWGLLYDVWDPPNA